MTRTSLERDRALHAAALALIVVSVALVYGPLFSRLGFRTHDFFWPYLRVQQYAADFAMGRLPQVLPYGALGAGYAYPFFYPPIGHWVAAALTLATGDAMLGVNLGYLLSVCASAVTMYAFVYGVARSRPAAVAAALAYCAMPYRFVDIFVRGALTEAWTFAWYPLIALGVWRAATRRDLPWYLPVALAGLVLTHNITAVYFLAFYVALAAVAVAWAGWRTGGRLAAALLLAAGLSLWFVLPQQYYLPSIWASDARYEWADAAHVHAHRATLAQLFSPTVTDWWGISQPIGTPDGMSFFVGPGQMIALGLALALALRLFPRETTDRRVAQLASVMAVGWLLTIAFIAYPLPILRLLPASFAYVQFPWRLLGLTAFFAAALLGLCLALVRVSRATSAVLVGVAGGTLFLVPPYQRHPSPARSSASYITPQVMLEQGRMGYMIQGEFLPREIVPLQLDRFLIPAPRASGNASVTWWEKRGVDVEARVTTTAPSTVVLPVVFYPFYGVVTDAGTTLRTSNARGLLATHVPAGTTRLRVTQRLTAPTRIGLAVSLVSAAVIAWLALAYGPSATRGTVPPPDQEDSGAPG